MHPEVSPERFQRWFDELAAIGRSERGWQRLAWSPLEQEARRWFATTAEEIGLEVERDGAGSLWAVTPGAGDAPRICAGSHLDTQPDGGAYDGALGVVCALAAADAILCAGMPPHRPLAVAALVDEEGARSGTPTFGSRAMTGALDLEQALAAVGDAAADYGITRASLVAARGQLARVAAFVEVHVEQGRRLAPAGAALGVADRLTPRQRWRAVAPGEADHAGTTAMADRRDALVEAARLVLALDELCRERPGCVGTVGRLAVEPGSANSIPGRVEASIDLRAGDEEAIEAVLDALRRRLPGIALERVSASAGIDFDADLRRRLFAAAAACGATAVDCPSYAGHDAGVLAAHVPAAMLFVRNPGGHSHTPKEEASPADCLLAARTLTAALAGLAGEA